jgi:hypothetical protein
MKAAANPPLGPSIALRERRRSELTDPKPGQVALQPRQSECAGSGTGMIEV